MRSRLLVAVLLVLSLVAGSCGDDDGDDSSSLPEAAELGDREPPEVDVPDEEPPAALEVEDLVVGTGAEATPGATVTMHYVGALWSNGEPLDSSWEGDGDPIDFVLGAGQVIPGWDRGVNGMRVGGRRRLVIPPDLAYGATGRGEVPPDETLVFVVDLVSVTLPVR